MFYSKWIILSFILLLSLNQAVLSIPDRDKLLQQLDQAQTQLDLLIEKNDTKQRVNAYISVALIYAELEQMRTAQSYWKEAIVFADTLKTPPMASKVRFQFAKFLMHHQSWHSAQSALDTISEKALIMTPEDHIQWLLMYGKVLSKIDRSDDAIDLITNKLISDKNNKEQPLILTRGYQLLGEIYFDIDFFAKSIHAYNLALSQYKEEGVLSFDYRKELILDLSKVYRAIEDFHQSLSLIEGLIKTLNTDGKNTDKTHQAELMKEVSFDLVNLNRYGEAKNYLNQAVTLYRESKTRDNHKDISMILFLLGEVHLQASQEAQARLYFEQILNMPEEKIDTDLFIKAHIKIGEIIFRDRKDLNEAYKIFRKALNLANLQQIDKLIAQSLKYMSEIASLQKSYREAFQMQQQFLVVKRRLDFKEERRNAQKVASPLQQRIIELNLEIKSKKDEIMELKNSWLTSKRHVKIIFVVSFIIITGLLLVLYWGKTKISRVTKKHGNELLDAYRKIENLSYKDKLTGCHNKAAAMGILNQAKASADRQLKPLSIAFIKMNGYDNFKNKWGQDSADFALVTINQGIRNLVREQDTLSRWDIDTFALFLPDTPLEGASVVIKKIRKSIAAATLDFFDQNRDENKKLEFTISSGVSRYLPRRNNLESVLFEAANALDANTEKTGSHVRGSA